MTYYKVLNTDGSCYHGGAGRWPENVWMPKLDESNLEPCHYGYHILEAQDLVYWLGPAIAPVEVPATGRIIRHTDKVVVAKARRGPFLETWNKTTQCLFAADCAEHVLHIYEARYPDNKQPRRAIEVARLFALGKATQEDLHAYAAAYAAATAAAYAADHAAANAAHAAANAANAAHAAAHAAHAAANAAAAAAYAADHAATAHAAEREWQTIRLWQYLNGEVNYAG